MSKDKKGERKVLTIRDLADKLRPIYGELRELLCKDVNEEAERRFKDDPIVKEMWKREEIDRRSTFSALLMARVALNFPQKILISRFLSLPSEAQAAIAHFSELVRHGILTTLRFIAERHLDAGIDLQDGDIEQLLLLIAHVVCSEATFLAVEAREPTIDSVIRALTMKKQLTEKMGEHLNPKLKSRLNYMA